MGSTLRCASARCHHPVLSLEGSAACGWLRSRHRPILPQRARPADLRALADHRLIVGHGDGATFDWQFKGADGAVALTPAGAIRSNDGEDLRGAVLAGLGIAHGPSALFGDDLDTGKLVRILETFAPDPVPIRLVSVGGRKLAYRVRLLLDFLAATFATEPSLRAG